MGKKESLSVKLSDGAVKEIERLLSSRRGVEIKIRRDKIVIWEVASKTKYEQAIT